MDITKICMGVITLLVAVITGFVVPTLRKKYGQEKINEVLAKSQTVRYWIGIFVAAAEQIFPAMAGADKKSYVLGLIGSKLLELGISVDEKILNAQIESAVLELHSSLNPSTPEVKNPEPEC